MNSNDHWTQLVDKVLDLLLVNAPRRTSLGAAMGLLVHLVTLIFEPTLKTVTYLNLTQLPIWGWPIAGIVVMNGRQIISALKDDTMGDEQIDLAIKMIERGKLPAEARQRQYALLIAKVIKEVKFNPQRTTDLRTD
jgi:hypothetical protein